MVHISHCENLVTSKMAMLGARITDFNLGVIGTTIMTGIEFLFHLKLCGKFGSYSHETCSQLSRLRKRHNLAQATI